MCHFFMILLLFQLDLTDDSALQIDDDMEVINTDDDNHTALVVCKSFAFKGEINNN